MTDLPVSSLSAGRRHKRTLGKKHSTRVDMTPMCDVGFLLITFFMLTTTLQRPKTMNLFLPHDVKDDKDRNLVGESQALTILIGKDGLYYYYGIGKEAATDPVHRVLESSYSLKDGIGDIIAGKFKSVIRNSGGKDSIVVIIKPTKGASYQNVVNILDDMNIYAVKRYALVPASPNDQKMIDFMIQGR